jgi:hypothetical protein
MKASVAFVAGVALGVAMSAAAISRSIGSCWSYFPFVPRVLFVENEQASSRIWYDAVGHLAGVTFYSDTTPAASLSFHGNGRVAKIGQYQQGLREGRWESFLPDGSPTYTAEFLHDNLVSGDWPLMNDHSKQKRSQTKQ